MLAGVALAGELGKQPVTQSLEGGDPLPGLGHLAGQPLALGLQRVPLVFRFLQQLPGQAFVAGVNRSELVGV